jgi:YidC/Oxa1 family membrane protein insertase
MGGIVTDAKLTWELSGRRLEKSVDAERNNSTIFYKEEAGSRDYLSETGDDDETLEEPLDWVAFKQNFFSAILMKQEGGAPFGKNAKLETRHYDEETAGDTLTQYYFAEIPIPDASDFNARLFLGPNDYKTLRAYGMEIDKTINLGWGIFGWVNRFLVIPIFDWLENFGVSYGIIILILTLIIKTILAPLTWKNYLSSARMRVLKPEIDALNEKHKDAEPMKKQQATMELYRKTGVSPFAGCLPMVVQLPILYAMFRFFPNAIQLRQESFLWADDLSSYDSIASLPFEIPFYGDHVSLFTLLMAVSTFAYTMMNSSNMPTQSQPGMPNMKVIMYIFPFMMLFFFNSFASGLSYYYFLANLISLIQMFLIKKFLIDEDKIKAKIDENKKKRGKMGKSKFQKKLEEMAKQKGIKP